MMTETLIIAELSTAIYRNQHGEWVAVYLENNELIDCSYDLSQLLNSNTEKRLINPSPQSREELISILNNWSQRYYLLSLLVNGMNAVYSNNTRLMALQHAQSLLTQNDLKQFVEARLLGCPLAEQADLNTALQLAQNLPTVFVIYQQLKQATVIEQLTKVYAKPYTGTEFARVCVESGLIKTAVLAVAKQDKKQLDKVVSKYKHEPQLKTLVKDTDKFLTAWQKALNKTFAIDSKNNEKTVKNTARHDDEIAAAIDDWLQEIKTGKYKKRKFVNDLTQLINKEKDFIIKQLKNNRIQHANNAVRDLVEHHRQTGQLKHLCKSLSDLGTQSCALNAEFALRLFKYAQQANNKDAVAFNGYAETLRSLGRLNEALIAYQEIKLRFPNEVFAYTGYAETLRSLGRLDDALIAYEETKLRFPDNEVTCTGYAETLRSLGRLDEALIAYEDIIKQFPNNRVAKNALACLLIEMNQLEKVADYLIEPKTLNTEDNWRDYHVLSLLAMHTGDFNNAEVMMRRGINAPFMTTQHVFKTSLGLLLLRTQRAKEAATLICLQLTEVPVYQKQALLYAHVLIERGEPLQQVQTILNKIPQETSAEIIDFCAIFKKRYLTNQLFTSLECDALDTEIYRQEFNLLLRAA
ncbi:MAG: tetratricopeptide repeat protein [Methylococcaceae bacterium]